MTNYELTTLPDFSGREGPLVFIIMDGIGLGPENENNAYYLTNTPSLYKIK